MSGSVRPTAVERVEHVEHRARRLDGEHAAALAHPLADRADRRGSRLGLEGHVPRRGLFHGSAVEERVASDEGALDVVDQVRDPRRRHEPAHDQARRGGGCRCATGRPSGRPRRSRECRRRRERGRGRRAATTPTPGVLSRSSNATLRKPDEPAFDRTRHDGRDSPPSARRSLRAGARRAIEQRRPPRRQTAAAVSIVAGATGLRRRNDLTPTLPRDRPTRIRSSRSTRPSAGEGASRAEAG